MNWTPLRGMILGACLTVGAAHAHSTYNIAGYGDGVAGSTNGADGQPGSAAGGTWTDGGVAAYAGSLPVMWYLGMHDTTTARDVQTGTAPTPAAGSLAAQIGEYNAANDPDLPTDRRLVIGGKSWSDPENEDQGWGHGLDYGLIEFSPLNDLLSGGAVTFTITLEDDPGDAASVRLALAVYGGWDTSNNATRHQTFVTSPAPAASNPLGSTGLTLIDHAIASAAGDTVTRTLSLDATHGGRFTVMVAALGGVPGQYTLTVTPHEAPPLDGDQDGVPDSSDNCLTVANPNQANADGDALGDACDPFPSDANNERAQCVAQLDTMTAELATATADADGDGRRDADDTCPGTPAGAPIDANGCSQTQFCGAFDVSSRASQAVCRRADWKNDEPVMTRKAADCAFSKSTKRCQPAL